MDHYSDPRAKIWNKLSGKGSSPCLLLARRQALPRLRPLEQSGRGVADRPTIELDVGRAVAAHARLGEPRHAHAQKVRCLLWRQQAFDADAGLTDGDGHDAFALVPRPLPTIGELRSCANAVQSDAQHLVP